MKKLRFLTTSGCHLCDQAWSMMERITCEPAIAVDVVDVADDDQLLEHYGSRIPVLCDASEENASSDSPARELSWPFSLAELRLWLTGLPGGLSGTWMQAPAKSIDEGALVAARTRQSQLTKPAGSLGLLENVVEQLAAMQGVEKPALEHVAIAVFAGDHGVVQQGVSAFPQEVTAQMLANFVNGGAAISILAAEQNCRLSVVDMGTRCSPLGWQGVIDYAAGQGTADMTEQPAMSQEQLDWCLAAGAAHVDNLMKAGPLQLLIAGEMGIGNTTSAAAIGCALTGHGPDTMTGRGTGVDDDGLRRKQQTIARALSQHHLEEALPLDVLRCLGGFELAAICGAMIRCAQRGVPVFVDGFIVTAAALVAVAMNPDIRHWLLWAHQSAEPGHRLMLEHLEASPLCSFGMRLGEGSGAAVALPLLRLACTLHGRMHTFAEASVSEQVDAGIEE